jgi:hypothetical protein
MPTKRRPRRFATAPVVPVPVNGSSTRSSGRDAARITRASSASGFWVGCSFFLSLPLSRSSPVHSAMVQSERTWISSLPALSAS